MDPWQFIRHFKKSEFTCRCGCGANGIDYDFVKQLDRAREIAGVPFIITSGYRCPRHDAEVGGSGNHQRGLAADIAVHSIKERKEILVGLLIAGFKRIGIGKEFLHVDAVPDNPEGIWVY